MLNPWPSTETIPLDFYVSECECWKKARKFHITFSKLPHALWLILIQLQLDDIKSIFNYFFCREKALSFGSWLLLLKAVPTANQPQSQSDIYSKEVCRDLTFENSGVEAGGPPLFSLLPWLEVREMEECSEGIHTLKSKRHRCLVLMHRACFSPCPPPQQCVFKYSSPHTHSVWESLLPALVWVISVMCLSETGWWWNRPGGLCQPSSRTWHTLGYCVGGTIRPVSSG